MRANLEKLARESQKLTESEFTNKSPRTDVQLMAMHSTYLLGINDSLKVICDILDMPYKKIESEMNNAFLVFSDSIIYHLGGKLKN